MSSSTLRRLVQLPPLLWVLLGACAAKKVEHAVGTAPVNTLDAGQSADAATLHLPPGDADGSTDTAGNDAGIDQCASVSREARTGKVPVDIIFLIDNSGSMLEEIYSIRQHINSDFADIIAASDVDYRVIMLSGYRDVPFSLDLEDKFVCIDPPLSGRKCDGVDEPFVTNGERFFQYNLFVSSNDAWCRMLDSLEEPDEWAYNDWAPDPQPPGLIRTDWKTAFPHGIKQVLRAGAFKSIVFFGDDAIGCQTKRAYDAVGRLFEVPLDAHPEQFRDGVFAYEEIPDRDKVVAARFDRALTARAPELFGTPENRNYRYHAIVGLDAKGAIGPDAPAVAGKCSTAERPGLCHQELSRLTGGLRYPVCNADGYDEVFRALAADSIATSRLPCRFEIPAPPDGETFAPGRVNLQYAHEGEPTRTIPRAQDAAHCGDEDAWFYDDDANPKSIVACPKTCSELSATQNGTVNIALGCETVVL